MRILVILMLSGTLGILGCDSSSSGEAPVNFTIGVCEISSTIP
jgi:hypothetical protein